MKDSVIKVENLWKRYGLPLPGFIRKGQRWCQQFLSSDNRQSTAGSNETEDGSFALKDVSFEVKRGETVGIIGHNGAGKSTLLKILAGVTPPTSGHVEVRGRVFPMIELNAGIHPELTGRENVCLLGAIMGLSRGEIEAKVPKIEEFCELKDWFDKPVRMYSSGMLARLGFGVALNIEADILLVDEVLAVGDLNFQRKCIEHMAKLQNTEITILLVTHAVRQAERVCQSGVLLENGRIIRNDTIRKVASQYYQDTVHQGYNRLRKQQQPVIFQDSGDFSLEEIAIRDLHGKPCDTVETGQNMSIYLRYSLQENIEDLVFHFGFVTSDMLRLTVFNSLDEPFPLSEAQRGIVECHLKNLPLMPGAYGLFLSVTRSNSIALFKGENLVTFEVIDPSFLYTRRNMELIALDVRWDFSLIDDYVGEDSVDYRLRKSE